jgi:hypothetical protein
MRNILTFILLGLVFLFQSCNSGSTSEQTVVPNEDSIDYLALGKEHAINTKSELGKNLTKALGEGGAEYAMTFCNTRAIPLTDSMSMELNAKMKRVSDRPRNPNNEANADELAFITMLKQNLEHGQKPSPQLKEMNGKMVGYYPILTNGMCLQCHGIPNDNINTSTLQKIKTLYPSDQATGYEDNQIRGLFVVEMNKR